MADPVARLNAGLEARNSGRAEQWIAGCGWGPRRGVRNSGNRRANGQFRLDHGREPIVLEPSLELREHGPPPFCGFLVPEVRIDSIRLAARGPPSMFRTTSRVLFPQDRPSHARARGVCVWL